MFFFAEAHQQPGLLGVIFDFKSNVINWLLLVGFLIYGFNKIVPPMLAQRERAIKEQMDAADRARKESEAFFLEQSSKLENAQKETDKIVDEAKQVAEHLASEIEQQTTREIAFLQAKLESAIANERQMIVTEVRSAAVEAAVKLSRDYLESNVSDSDNKRLLSEFMQELDGLSGPNGQSFAPGTAIGASGRTES